MIRGLKNTTGDHQDPPHFLKFLTIEFLLHLQHLIPCPTLPTVNHVDERSLFITVLLIHTGFDKSTSSPSQSHYQHVDNINKYPGPKVKDSDIIPGSTVTYVSQNDCSEVVSLC
jgi:hypothetical protein